ncbi:MAG: pyridoxal-dependent decarboxylase [Planctomycetota bacterium]
MSTPGPPTTTSDTDGPLLDPAELRDGVARAGTLLERFYAGLDERPVLPNPHVDGLIERFHGTLGEDGVGLDGALTEVEEVVVDSAMGIPHPLYLGLINSSPLPGGIVAESIVGGFNNNAGSWQQSPPFAAAEHEVLRCFRDLLGLPDEASGILLPGGSYATLHAMQLAREAKLPAWRREGPRALAGDPRVYVSSASHFSAARAAHAIGIAPKDVVHVACSGRGEMDPADLARRVAEDLEQGHLPFAVVATLGTTGTGAVDPLPELAEVCRAHDLWLHVDACYGGAAALLDELKPHFASLGSADSVAVDPHKWFFVPMVAGLVFTLHTALELETFDVDAPYIPSYDIPDAYRRGLPTSRRAAGFTVWMALRAHGLARVREEVRRNCTMARLLEDRLRDAGFRVLEGGEMSIACARWEPQGLDGAQLDDLQHRITREVVASGDAWFGTVRAGEIWLRFCLVSTFLREQHVDRLVTRVTEVARGLSAPR